MRLGAKTCLLYLLHDNIRYHEVEDIDLNLFPPFVDHFNFLFTDTYTTNYYYFDAHRDIDYYEQ